jgi:hypothetical protein
MRDLIARQMIIAHIRDVSLSKTVDPYRFSRMIYRDFHGTHDAGSLEQRIASVNALTERLDGSRAEYKTGVLEWPEINLPGGTV